MSTPLTTVKERFGSKEKLVEAVRELGQDLWIDRLSKDRNGSKGLQHVSNAKLLRLHAIFTQVKSEFGTREKLIDAILEANSRSKDSGYRARLESYPVPRLYDMCKSG